MKHVCRSRVSLTWRTFRIGSRRHNSQSGQNVITSFYVESNGEARKSGAFDKDSVLTDDVKRTVADFVQDKSILIKPGSSRTFYWPSESMPFKSIRLQEFHGGAFTLRTASIDICMVSVWLAFPACHRMLIRKRRTFETLLVRL